MSLSDMLPRLQGGKRVRNCAAKNTFEASCGGELSAIRRRKGHLMQETGPRYSGYKCTASTEFDGLLFQETSDRLSRLTKGELI